MDKDALIWFQDEVKLELFTLGRSLSKLFKSNLGHLMEALTRLKQVGTVTAYKAEFELLSNQIRGISQKKKIELCFEWFKG